MIDKNLKKLLATGLYAQADDFGKASLKLRTLGRMVLSGSDSIYVCIAYALLDHDCRVPRSFGVSTTFARTLLTLAETVKDVPVKDLDKFLQDRLDQE